MALLSTAPTALLPYTQPLRLAPWVRRYRPRLVAWPAGGQWVDAVSGRLLGSAISPGDTTTTRLGRATTANGTQGGWLLPLPQPATWTEFSLVAFWAVTGGGSNSYGRLIDGAARYIYMGGNSLEFQATFAGGPAFWSVAYPFDGLWHGMALTHDAGAATNLPAAWRDGTPLAAPSVVLASNGVYSGADTSLGVLNRADNGRCINGGIALLALFESVLPASVAARLSRPPMALVAA
ncbi:MAG: hypothetical protein RR101_15030 [Burkholderiaceae bacterium]